ncbi:hypothetical protein C8R44DRAFT_753382 [Mycena epipterygia]|nr:hypothetical protein C8R44DRAFT_753382 [Mycena epipterygia]
MTNSRFIRTRTGKTSIFLKARLYPARGRRSFVAVHVLCPRTQPRYPCVESVMNFEGIQAFVHDVHVHVLHRLPTGRFVFSVFRCFYKRHMRLPRNHDLDVQGDVVIMRVASKNFQSVVNMRGSDRQIADFVAEAMAPKLRQFQGPQRTPPRGLVLRMRNV